MKVKEAIEILMKMNPEAGFILEDPDTGWWMPPHISEERGRVFITGHYSEADSKSWKQDDDQS